MTTEKQSNEFTVDKRWDNVFNMLANQTRRTLLLSLMLVDRGIWISLPEAAMTDPRAERQEEVCIELRHRHLPKLAEESYVIWRLDPFEITHGPNFDEIAVILDAIRAQKNQLPNQLTINCEPFSMPTI